MDFFKRDFQVKHYHRLKACFCASVGSSMRALPAPPSIPQESFLQSQNTFIFSQLLPEIFTTVVEMASLQNCSSEGQAEQGWAWQSPIYCSWLGSWFWFVCFFMPSHKLTRFFFFFLWGGGMRIPVKTSLPQPLIVAAIVKTIASTSNLSLSPKKDF